MGWLAGSLKAFFEKQNLKERLFLFLVIEKNLQRVCLGSRLLAEWHLVERQLVNRDVAGGHLANWIG